MIVTTAGRTNAQMINRAESIADELNTVYLNRNKQSIIEIQQQYKEDVLVVGKNRLEVYPKNASQPLFFHPNSAMFRIKRLMREHHDPFIETADLKKGSSMLDCTLGLGSDSIVASFVVGSGGRVVAIEGQKIISYIVNEGLRSWESGTSIIDDAMRRIKVVSTDNYGYLKEADDNSFDVVYFDPMFEHDLNESNGIHQLKHYGIKSGLSSEVINEAKRVARKRIVLKDHWQSLRFDELGFTATKRKTSKFHFGVIILEK
ncbi:class I SAM-dependent methyltransferase [Litchfieldia alkalitelluris]|uniref:class I SAM-dependent methyltransferase n=1 Tax=Litchfieldia alkalitelluris TaxID=304268 RepID=UPI000998B9B7|nr:class I SAM-dependent methyltransferase [Litchfieldia alkalitelluris]